MDYEKIAEAANNIDKVIRDNQALKSLIVEASSVATGDQSQETRQSIQEFLEFNIALIQWCILGIEWSVVVPETKVIGDICQIIRRTEKQSSRRCGTDNVNLRVFAFRTFVIEKVDLVHPSEVIGTRILIEIHVKRFTNDPVFPDR